MEEGHGPRKRGRARAVPRASSLEERDATTPYLTSRKVVEPSYSRERLPEGPRLVAGRAARRGVEDCHPAGRSEGLIEPLRGHVQRRGALGGGQVGRRGDEKEGERCEEHHEGKGAPVGSLLQVPCAVSARTGRSN